MKKIIIFDVDGTLIDSMPAYTEIFSNVLYDKYGIDKTFSRKIYIETTGANLPEQFAMVLEEQRKDITGTITDNLQKEFWKRYNNYIVELFPDTIETVSILKKKGYEMAASSNTRQEILDKKFKETGLNEFINPVLGYEKGRPTKGRGHYSVIRETLEIKEGDILYAVGDSASDMKDGKEQGAVCIGKIGTISKDDLINAGAVNIIECLRELLDFFKT